MAEKCEFIGCEEVAAHLVDPLPLPGLTDPPPMRACARHYALYRAGVQRRAELQAAAPDYQRFADDTGHYYCADDPCRACQAEQERGDG
jgi:hypothetical protein